MNDQTNLSLRELLFGDLPLESWPASGDSAGELPWSLFAQARAALEAGEPDKAIQAWVSVLGTPGLECRHYLQAWHFLRQQGAAPQADQAKYVYGVVIEVGMDEGLDVLAAYQDGTARYLNYTGAAIIWEHPNDTLDAEIGQLLRAAQEVAQRIGPWENERPGPPRSGYVRLNMLTPSGLHFGEGPYSALAQDPMGGAILNAGVALMTKMTTM